MISKRSKYPNKRKAQFVFSIIVITLIITYFNGSFGLWAAAIAIPTFFRNFKKIALPPTSWVNGRSIIFVLTVA
ncbi:hypothetical protein AV654_28095 [Paenibacillus elgii]|uniref:Uncharacterized protein n=1 Tax=Paenibacillus elgii TaxID=189691 RepID=A0A163VFG5_9BACL|nr:hypothetical protein AV654_28095 [Paenibacillus elgii]